MSISSVDDRELFVEEKQAPNKAALQMGDNTETIEERKRNGIMQTLQLTRDARKVSSKKKTERNSKRLVATLEGQIDDVGRLEIKISRAYIEKKKDLVEVSEWAKDVNETLEGLEPVVEKLERNIRELQDQEQMAAKAKEERMDQELPQRQHEEGIKQERAMLQIK